MKALRSKNFRLVVVLFFVVISIFYLESQKAGPASSVSGSLEVESNVSTSSNPKDSLYPMAPELRGLHGFINTNESISIQDLKGKVVLIDFWTYSCINCIRTLPHLTSWYDKYSDKGLVIIGVHTPEFNFEKELSNVQMAVDKYNISYPVVLDNDYSTWTAYRNRFWPRKYLIDHEGYIRYDHIGEGAYDETEEMIKKLLVEAGYDVSSVSESSLSDLTPDMPLTPELYAGYKFVTAHDQDFGNLKIPDEGEVNSFILPNSFSKNRLYLGGDWFFGRDGMHAKSMNESSIVLDYTASNVNIVSDSNSTSGSKLFVFLDGSPVNSSFAGDDVIVNDSESYVLVKEARLYNVIKGDYGNHLLMLNVNDTSFSFNAFTFG